MTPARPRSETRAPGTAGWVRAPRHHDDVVRQGGPVGIDGQYVGAVRRAVGGDHLDRGIGVLQAVAFAAAPVRLDDLVSATGLARGDVARTVDQLVAGGLVARDERHRVVPGWLLHGLGSDGQDSIEHAELALDEEFAAFVSERLTEEVVAATFRREHAGHAPGGPDDRRAEAGLRVLHDLLLDLQVGAVPDDVTLGLLARAYAAHPDFRPRWAHPAALLARPGDDAPHVDA